LTKTTARLLELMANFSWNIKVLTQETHAWQYQWLL